MQQCFKDLWSKHKSSIATVAAVIVLYLFMFCVGITCPIKFFTGISCPGCGMSRALFSAVRLDFASAFAYHPLWIYLPFATFFLLLFRIKKMKCAFNITLVICACAMLSVYIYRLCFVPQEIVVFSPSESAFVKLFNLISAFLMNDCQKAFG